MAYKQKNSKLNSLSIAQQYERRGQTDERKLIEVWQEYNVNDGYQTMVLKYFDGLSSQKLKKELQSELHKTYEKSSFYFKIQYLVCERQIGIGLLKKYSEQLEKYKNMRVKDTPELERVCDLIDHIRKTSMLICQAVWDMLQYYEIDLSKCNKNSGCQYYLNLFRTFDKDIEFLRQSLLRYYIPFSNIYDPLLLQSAKNLKLLYNENRIVFDENVNQLFTLNVSYLYRLLRAHQRMFQFLTLGKEMENEAILTNHYFYSQQKGKKEKLTLHEKQPKVQLISLSNQRYKNQELSSENMPQKGGFNQLMQNRKGNSSNEMSLPKPSQSKNSNRDNKNSEQSNKNKLSSNEYSKQKKMDKRAIISCGSITIYNQQSKNKMNLKKQEESSDQSERQSELPININPSARDRQSLKSLSKNKNRNKTQPALVRKSRNQLYENEVQFDGSFSKNNPVVSQKKKKPKQMPAKRKQCQTHPFTLHRKQSRSVHLPKLSGRSKTKHQQQDCLCRRRFNSRKLKESYVDMPEEEVEQKRKMIINKINQRYRQMAKKQIRYEMSKMGDRTYHKMKNSSINSRILKTHKMNKRKIDDKYAHENITAN